MASLRDLYNRWKHLWKVLLGALVVIVFLTQYQPKKTSDTTVVVSEWFWLIGGVSVALIALALLVWLVRKYWRRPPPPPPQRSRKWLWVIAAPLMVLVGAWVAYTYAPEAWKLKGYEGHLLVGTLGLAVALGFALSSLSWKKRGMWVGGVVALTSFGVLLWQMGGWTRPNLSGIPLPDLSTLPKNKEEFLKSVETSDLQWLAPYLFIVPLVGFISHYFSDTKEVGYKKWSTTRQSMTLALTAILLVQFRDFLAAFLRALGLSLHFLVPYFWPIYDPSDIAGMAGRLIVLVGIVWFIVWVAIEAFGEKGRVRDVMILINILIALWIATMA